MVEAGGHAIVASPADADVAMFNSCAVTVGRRGRAAQSRATRRAPAAGVAQRRHGLRRRRSTTIAPRHCAFALADGRARRCRRRSRRRSPKRLDLASRRDVRLTRAQTRRARLAAHSGRLRRALHVLRDDARARRESQSSGQRARRAKRARSPNAMLRSCITGIHIGTYGADIGSSLGALIERLVRDVPSVRFRLSSIEATEIDDALLELFVGAPRNLVPHLHAPLQSGSDRVLKPHGAALVHGRERMRRRSSGSLRACPCSGSAPTSSPVSRARRDDDHRRDSRARRATAVHVPARVSVFACGRARPRSGCAISVAAARCVAARAELRALRRPESARRTGRAGPVAWPTSS